MKSNDLLFLYTDGLSEALNVEGEEFGASQNHGHVEVDRLLIGRPDSRRCSSARQRMVRGHVALRRSDFRNHES